MDMATIMVGQKVQEALNELRPLFHEDVELTFIARMKGNDEADLVLTNDTFEALIACIERTKDRSRR